MRTYLTERAPECVVLWWLPQHLLLLLLLFFCFVFLSPKGTSLIHSPVPVLRCIRIYSGGDDDD